MKIMPYARFTALLMMTSALTSASHAAVIDYPDGSDRTAPIVLTDNSTQLQVLSGTATQSGAISETGGSFSLVKVGTGTLTVSSANTYTGGTIIDAGTLSLTGTGTLGSGAITDAGTLRTATTTTKANSIIFSAGTDNVISAAAGTTLNLTGNLTFNTSATDGHKVVIGSASDTGTVNITSSSVTLRATPGPLEIVGGILKDTSNGTPQSSFATALGNLSSVTIDSGATLEIDSNGNGRGSANETYIKLFGAGNLVIGGSDLPRVVLGSSDFSGQISAAETGYIGVGNTNGVPRRDTVILTANNNAALEFQIGTGSTLQIGDGGTTGSLTDSSHIVGYSNDNGDAVLRLDRSDNVTLGSSLVGSFVLQQAGSGVLTIARNNTYYPPSAFYGSVVVSSGGLSLSSDTALNGAPIALNNGTILYTTATDTYTSPVSISGNATFNVANAATATWTGQISNGANTGGLIKDGFGTLILSGTSSFAGGITVHGGTLQASSANFSSTNGLTLDGGSLRLAGDSGDIGRGDIIVTAAGGTIDTNGHNMTLTGSVVGPGKLIKTGEGTLEFDYGSFSNAGGVILDEGVLSVPRVTIPGPIAVNGGTLKFEPLNGHLDAIIGPISGTGGTIVLDSTGFQTVTDSTTTLASVITGHGGITKGGTGTLILTANNTYTGGSSTTISNGALQVGNGGTTGAIPGDVVDNGALSFDRSDTVLFGGLIYGLGSLHQMSTGTLILTADDTYTGGTVIDAGTLQAGNGGTNGLLMGNVTDNGTLAFNHSDTVTFNGAISGIGVLKQVGSGSLILTGENIYSGGTFIDAGMLQVGNGGTDGSLGSGAVVDNGSLVFNRSDTITVANAISGTGSVAQAGSGTLTLSGTSSVTGPTTVRSGTLMVNGFLAASAVTVQSGAILAGSGTVGGTMVQSNATLAPGGSAGAAGTLAVAGNLTLAAGSTYTADLSPTAADRVTASGTATLAGALVLSPAAGSYVAGTSYTLVSAAGGLSGSFSSVTASGLPGTVKARIAYDANDALLYLDPNAITPGLSSGATPNQKSLAAGIDAALAHGASLPAGFNALFGLSGAPLGAALDQLSGQIGAAATQSIAQGFLPFLSLLQDQSQTGGSVLTAANFAPGSAYNAGSPHPAMLAPGAVRVWGAAYGGHVGLSADAATGAASLSDSIWGFAAGLEAKLTDDISMGASIAGGHQDFSAGNGTGESGDVMLGLSGRIDVLEQGYLSGALAYGFHDITTSRVVTVSGTDVLAAKFNAHDFGGRIEAGYRFALDGDALLAPYAAFAGESFDSPAYTETAASGSSTFALSYAAHATGISRSELGAHLGEDFALDDGTVSFEGTAAWAHQLEDAAFSQVAFQSVPGSAFTVFGTRPAIDTALLGAKVKMQTQSGLSYGVSLNGQFGNGTTAIVGSGSVAWRF